ncbi:unnamed protein product [Prorocentrum cordatum]|uniref:Uncharacterized protein n=1 Tax=Prorocentrum cordatum TaxID=2364126 RepID=A0ABN9UKA1_9DINO|nr:unnamed protein product [Polarella glacialis]
MSFCMVFPSRIDPRGSRGPQCCETTRRDFSTTLGCDVQVSRLDKEAAAFLAEMMVLPMEVAVRSLEAAGGDVDAAVDVALAASRRRFSRSLALCPAAVVDLEADDEVSRWA